MDKAKVALSKENGKRLFQVFSNGQMLSTGLNIMMVKEPRNNLILFVNIVDKYGDKVKYIHQIELLELSNRGF